MTGRPSSMDGFLGSVRRALRWRTVIAAQLLGALFALTPWLEQAGQASRPHLGVSLAQQAFTALYLTLVAFGGDEAVRRGWPLWRAFLAALSCASAATAFTLMLINWPFGAAHDVRTTLVSFLNVGSYWGIVLMVYLNRQSSARLLARVRKGQLGRVQAESRLIAADMAAVEAQIDPIAVSRDLERVRDQYAANDPMAETTLDALIADLRGRVAQCTPIT